MHYIAATTDADDDDDDATCPSMASTRTVVVNWTASQISQKKSKSFARFFQQVGILSDSDLVDH